MKFYMIYSNQFASGNKPIGIASLASVLKSNGHEFKLMDCTQFQISEQKFDNNSVHEVSLEFKPATNPERLCPRKRVSFHELYELIIEDIDAFGPDVIGLTGLTDDYPLGINILRQVRQAFSPNPYDCGRGSCHR